ncbi:MAG TPA: contractile injection system protein, VgrG/Pvc8 family [Syntrophobacteria bacterium]|nr:contractile injection system protein, VgrG/Pvc8 family [Syntrophobacteria bacterium]
MPTGPDTETLIADYEIASAGSRIPPEAQALVAGVEVDLDVENAGMFSLLLHAGEREQARYAWIDGDLFKPGTEIKIKIGYGSTLMTMIAGEITALTPEYPDNGAVVLRVRGYDRLYRLGFGRKTYAFRNMKDSDIASQIAQDWSLTPTVDPTDTTHDYVLQCNQTDREFLAERAGRLRYELRVEDRTLYFQKPKEDAAAVTTLTYGETLVDFFPALSTVRQTSKAAVQGWSVKDKKAVAGTAASGDVISTMGGSEVGPKAAERIAGDRVRTLAGENVAAQGEAEALAKAALNRAATEYITGEGSSVGNPDIKAGTVLDLQGLGQRFSGRYYVTACRHTLGGRGYHTHFTVRRSAA